MKLNGEKEEQKRKNKPKQKVIDVRFILLGNRSRLKKENIQEKKNLNTVQYINSMRMIIRKTHRKQTQNSLYCVKLTKKKG